MRILGMGEHVNLGDMYLRLQQEGHEVIVYADDADARETMAGMLTVVDSWRDRLDWVRAAGDDGIIVFETAAHGELQDSLRAEGFHVVGNCALGARLEEDRLFAQSVLAEHGMRTAAMHEFTGFDDAIRFVEIHRGRWVVKMTGGGYASWRNYVGVLDDGRDVLAVLRLQRDSWSYDETPRLVLMEHLQGVEIGVGAYFDGRRFLEPACLDWEHKRFFTGNLGELTGEMGTLVTYEGWEPLFAATLGRLTELLAGSGYVGYINLNTIVNADGVWPLEFTTRFGYPGYAILDALHDCSWADILRAMALGDRASFPVHAGYAVGVVLTVPPFPYAFGYERLGRGAPVLFRDGMTSADRDNLHYGEVAMRGDVLVTSGSVGYVLVATGRGANARAAQRAAYAVAEQVVIPNVRYRTDIAEQFIQGDHRQLQAWGWM